MSEVRLIPVSEEDFEQAVATRVLLRKDWDAGITEEENGLLLTALADCWVMQSDDEPAPHRATVVWRKLRAAFNQPKGT